MAIDYRSQTSLPSATRTTTTVNMPAGVQAGDVVLIWVSCGGSTSVTPTAPGTVTPVTANFAYSDNSPAWTVNTRVWRYVVVGSGDPSSFAFTHSSTASEAVAIAFPGVDTTTPIDATPTTNGANNAGSTTATALGVTTTVPGVEIVVFRGSWDGNAITPPSGFTERLDQPVTWVGTQNMAAAGATGNFVIPTGNGGSSPWACVLVPLRPAGAGGTQHAATGTIAVTTAASGSPVASLVATGMAAVVAAAVGAPAALHPATGTTPVVSSANGAPAALHPATGTVAVTTGAAGAPTALHPANATTPVVTTAIGTASAIHLASGVVAVTTAANGSPDSAPGSGSHAATGTIAVITTADGSAGQRHAATGTAAVTTSAAGAASTRFAAAGTCAVATSVVGTAAGRYVANGTVIVVTTANGTANVFDPEAPLPIAPAERTHTVTAETRTLVVPAESRRLTIAATSRTVTAEPEE